MSVTKTVEDIGFEIAKARRVSRSIKLPEPILEWLERKAEKNGTSVPVEINKILIETYKQEILAEEIEKAGIPSVPIRSRKGGETAARDSGFGGEKNAS